MIRIVQIALLILAAVTLAAFVRWGDAQLPQRVRDVLSGIPIGFAICYGLWHWSDHIRDRQGGDRRGD